MACTNFFNCLADPYTSTPDAAQVGVYFAGLSEATNFFLNLFIYTLQVFMVIMIGVYLFRAVYSFYGAKDSAESFQKFRDGVLDIVLVAFCLAVLFGARFIVTAILQLAGVIDANNPFL